MSRISATPSEAGRRSDPVGPPCQAATAYPYARCLWLHTAQPAAGDQWTRRTRALGWIEAAS